MDYLRAILPYVTPKASRKGMPWIQLYDFMAFCQFLSQVKSYIGIAFIQGGSKITYQAYLHLTLFFHQ